MRKSKRVWLDKKECTNAIKADAELNIEDLTFLKASFQNLQFPNG